LNIEPLVVPRWRRLLRRIINGSDNTKFTSPQQFYANDICKLLIW